MMCLHVWYFPLLLTLWARFAVSSPVSTGQRTPAKQQLCVGLGDYESRKAQSRHYATVIPPDGEKWSSDEVADGREERRPTPTQKPTFKADIRVDTNRDGVVDIYGSTDVDGKDTWTEDLGAIFLANIGDSKNRCRLLNEGQGGPNNVTAETLRKCHDAIDDEQRAPKYMAPIRTVPIPNLGESATGTIRVTNATARGLVRVFRQAEGGGWEFVSDATVFRARDIAQGLILGIDARDTRRENGWDGRVTIEYTVKDGNAVSRDTVMLRVAPVLLQHHLQSVDTVFVSSTTHYRNPRVRQIAGEVRRGIESNMRSAGLSAPILDLDTRDTWAQDIFEPGYTSMPGPNGTSVTLRILIEGRFRKRYNDRPPVYSQLRGDGVGGPTGDARSLPRDDDDNFQAGGNIETIPPYEHNGKKFPAGRILMGGNGSEFPRARDFFIAQEMQEPLILDSTWLSVGHIDEIIQIVPSTTTKRGWAVLAVDPNLGLRLLRDAWGGGDGNQTLMNPKHDYTGLGFRNININEFLAIDSNIKAAEACSQRMNATIERLRQETGLDDGEIFRVPALFGEQHLVANHLRGAPMPRNLTLHHDVKEQGVQDPGDQRSAATAVSRRQSSAEEPIRYESWLPSLVNGVPLSDSYYLAPKPNGPIIGGRDIFQEDAAQKYKNAGVTTVGFLDDWIFHMVRGDLHCVTNTYRDVSAPWWKR